MFISWGLVELNSSNIATVKINVAAMNFSESTYEDEFIMFMRSQEALLGLGEKSGPQVQGISPQQQSAMMRLTKHRAFKDLVQKVKGSPVGFQIIIKFLTLSRIDVCFLLHVPVVLQHTFNEFELQEFQSWLDSAAPELDVVPVWNEDKSFSKESKSFYLGKINFALII